MRMKLSSGLLLCTLATASVAHADDPLDQVSLAQAKTQAPDARQHGDFFRGAGAKSDYSVLLEANKCYWFSGAGENLKKLYLYLWKPNSNFFSPRVADAKGATSSTLAYCTQEAGLFKFQVKTEGKGRFVVGVFEKDSPTPAVPPPVAAVVDLPSICDKTAAAASQGLAKRQGEFLDGSGSSLGHDDRGDYSVMMEGGKCYWVVGCGEPDKVKSLYLYLWDPHNKRVTEAKPDSATVMVGHCPAQTGMFKVEAKMNSGKGAWKVGVYTK
jgi:hypothetical protein